ncbi:MAG: PQQ-binding-like beta-propeller repeat protein, partial [Candidatus Latescibacterota bacterium]
GMIFVGSYDKNMYCLNMETGSLIERFSAAGEIYSSPAVGANRLYFGSNKGEFFCLVYSNDKTS